MCCLLSVLFPWASQVALVVKNPPDSAGDIRDSGSIPGLGGSPGRGPGKTLQYSCLENPLDRGAWWATVHRVSKSRTGLKRLSTHTRAISPLDCEHIKDNSHWLLCLYSPKVCAGHTVGFQQVFVDLLKIKGGLNVRKEESEKNWVLRGELFVINRRDGHSRAVPFKKMFCSHWSGVCGIEVKMRKTGTGLSSLISCIDCN